MRVNVVTLLPLLLTFAQALSAPSDHAICDVDTASARSKSTWIGKDKNVEVYTVSCPTPARHDAQPLEDLSPRQTATPTNVCGAQCNTNCFTPSGGGPDPSECHVIADALLFAGENTGAIFPVGIAPNNTIVMQYRSCKTFFLNQDLGPVAYCRSDWASLVDWLATSCQATKNAHGGNCVAKDQKWFVQNETIQLLDLNTPAILNPWTFQSHKTSSELSLGTGTL